VLLNSISILTAATDFNVSEGTPYVVLMWTQGGGYTLILLTTTAWGDITTESFYNMLGGYTGFGIGEIGTPLGNYMDQHGLGIEDSCQYDPTCFSLTSSNSLGD
jgi:hypothetical protein